MSLAAPSCGSEHTAQLRGNSTHCARRSGVVGPTVLSGDVAAAVREVEGQVGGELHVHGIGNPDPVAAGERLVHEMTLIVVAGYSRPGRGFSRTPARILHSGGGRGGGGGGFTTVRASSMSYLCKWRRSKPIQVSMSFRATASCMCRPAYVRSATD